MDRRECLNFLFKLLNEEDQKKSVQYVSNLANKQLADMDLKLEFLHKIDEEQVKKIPPATKPESKKNAHQITVYGKKYKNLKHACEKMNLKYQTAVYRRSRGWDTDEIFRDCVSRNDAKPILRRNANS